jgi:hypothetical protein
MASKFRARLLGGRERLSLDFESGARDGEGRGNAPSHDVWQIQRDDPISEVAEEPKGVGDEIGRTYSLGTAVGLTPVGTRDSGQPPQSVKFCKFVRIPEKAIDKGLSDGGRRGDVPQILPWSSAILTYESTVRDARHVNLAIPRLGCHTSRCSSGTQSQDPGGRRLEPVETPLPVHTNDTPAGRFQVYVRVPSRFKRGTLQEH